MVLQELDDFGMALHLRRPKRGKAVCCSGGIDVSPGCQQELDDLGVAVLRRYQERGHALFVLDIDIGAGIDGGTHLSDVASPQRHEEIVPSWR